MALDLDGMPGWVFLLFVLGHSTLLEDEVLSPSFSVLGLHYSHLNVESIFTVQGVRVTPSRLLLGFKTGKRKRVQLFLKSASVDL